MLETEVAWDNPIATTAFFSSIQNSVRFRCEIQTAVVRSLSVRPLPFCIHGYMIVSGVWGVGLATRSADLNCAPGGHDEESWVLCWDGVIRHNNKEMSRLSQAPQEGDVLVRTHHLFVCYWRTVFHIHMPTAYSQLVTK
ncbi:hypothetical protein PR048_014255 [Dryococelus australis]|uniref:Uncharacterized protein n=1 Tax=Dryococelus australis TaxID=614101 RepID=A0ABQ9HDP1_9NEOP|nr:hypothetical protein PR048_014255 [Dryococelus australis]